MRISETFFSVQGEGKLTGVPSVFIRTSGCNLRCRWCDTPYASWNPEGDDVSVEDILAEVNRHPTRYVVVTGGEPTIAAGMRELLQGLRDAGKHITIETAGTVMPTDLACDLASLSPKLANSTPSVEEAGRGWHDRHEKTRWQPEVLRAWTEACEHQLKFVVSAEADLLEIENLLAEAKIQTAPENILLMPEGREQTRLHALAPQVVEWCKIRGWRFCARLHIDLFGNKRGT
ncbi:7-carboxy-7-deazaguanine synthase QueE [Verrucomicrobium spinosum]|uniref:7-carboxy-7-deazaguanine synthase QueE n=1 Tax=Verrucomicrobium spinosum TaxID=2736 RepID=UPI0001745314|nr:7-carboxy-7-deazaguanine synthase QueE [Verrucomicrobium spinosum]